ncbi:Cloroperoxidase [Sistotremastrum suecicum HHB10207 ss-3]|uniref:Cloroperoxidase n=1 Tax=Sistotremastrum suecicum HHB10207 ss-3 TaxID=1314776 RepID=A0A166B834_9AGAM|nr:Cloroperoxidase [Sistotremastrum suecicum HHB10207 ss-3]
MRSLLLSVLVLGTVVSAFPSLSSRPRASAYANAPSAYPYTSSPSDGLPGTGKGGYLVPDPNDALHAFQPPPDGAQRGPCPGMNVLANHGFIARDGITDFDEIVKAQQDVFNVGWDLSVFLATLAVALDGDLVTQKLSIGGDATNRTALLTSGILGFEGGLNTHNTFEADASLARNDYYTSNGDDHTFNTTLFSMMTSTVSSTSSLSSPLYDLTGISLYRAHRWNQSVAENPNFYFGPKALLLYGAATFLYELYPSDGPGGVPDKATIESFFGAVPSADGGYSAQPERIPEGWYNRKTPYTLVDVVEGILEMYLANPVLFGGNTAPGRFDAIEDDGGFYEGGRLKDGITPESLVCLLYQIALTDFTPDSLSGGLKLPEAVLEYVLGKLNPIFGPLGCTLVTGV